MKTAPGRALSVLIAVSLVVCGNPGTLWAQAVMVQRAVPRMAVGFAPAGAAPTLGSHPINLAPVGPTGLGVSPSVRSPQAKAAISVPAAAVAAPAASAAIAAPAAATVLPIRALKPSAPAAQETPGFTSPIGRTAGAGVVGLTRRLAKAPLSVQLPRLFDGNLKRGLAEAAPVARANAATPERPALSEPAPQPSVQPSSPIPSPAAPAKRGVWKRNLVLGAVGLSLLGGAVAFGPQLLHFAENFGSNLTLSSDLNLGSFAIAFAAGLLSFLSPCTLPLIPAYLSFVSGASLEDLKSGRDASWRRSVVGALVFVAGFSTVFTILGATATAMGALLVSHMPVIAKAAGVVVAVMGLHTMGVLKIGLLYREKRADVGALKIKSRLLTAFLMGLAFAFGWAPCIGPILAGILGMAAMGDTVLQGTALLAAYSLGLGVPFILAALGVNRFLKFFGKYKRYLGVGEHVTGGLLVAVGLLIFFGGLQQVSAFFGF